MRFKYYSFLLAILIKGCLFAQATFNKTIDFSDGNEVGWCVLQQDDGYILIGAGWGFEIGDYFDQKVKFAKTDLEGNVLWTNFIGEPGIHLFCSPQAGIITQDENIVFCGSKLTAVTYSVILVKFNPISGDTIFFKEFNFDDVLKGVQVKELSDGNFIILAFDENDAFGSILIKTNSDGEFIWQKRYGNSNEIEARNFAINNDTILLISRNLFCTPEGYKIRKIDTAGNIIQELTFAEDCPSMGFASNQGGYFGIGVYFPTPPYQSFVYRADANGIIQWHYNTTFDLDTLLYEQIFPENIREMSNGDIVVSGYFASNFLGTYLGLVSKINTDGMPYWERIYMSNFDIYDDCRLLDMQIEDDGHIIMIGAGFSEIASETQNFWLLRLDSLGCLVPGCDTIGDQIFELPIDQTGILIYPNPMISEAIIQLTFDQPIQFENELTVNITDVNGRLISTFHPNSILIDGNKLRFGFNRKGLPAGVYTFQILTTEQFFGTYRIVVK